MRAPDPLTSPRRRPVGPLCWLFDGVWRVGCDVVPADRTATRGATSQLWKTSDAKANKAGPHHTVFGVKKNREYEESVRLGLPAPKAAGPYTPAEKYVGDWSNNKREGYGTLTKVSTAGGERGGGGGGCVPDGLPACMRRGLGCARAPVWGYLMGVSVCVSFGSLIVGVYVRTGYVCRSEHGVCARAQPNGDKYEGEWVGGLKHGGGTQWVRRDGKLRKLYTGDWVAGKQHVRTSPPHHLCPRVCVRVFVCVCVWRERENAGTVRVRVS